jgi:hypothetical protein
LIEVPGLSGSSSGRGVASRSATLPRITSREEFRLSGDRHEAKLRPGPVDAPVYADVRGARGHFASAGPRSVATRDWLPSPTSPSTISREVGRHYGQWMYRGGAADRHVWRDSSRPTPCRLANCPALRQAIAAKLSQQWSPQQISGWLHQTFPGDLTCRCRPKRLSQSVCPEPRHV